MDFFELRAQFRRELASHHEMQVFPEVWVAGAFSDLLLQVDGETFSQHSVGVWKVNVNKLVQNVSVADCDSKRRKLHETRMAFPDRNEGPRKAILPRHVNYQIRQVASYRPLVLRSPPFDVCNLSAERFFECLLLKG